MCLLFFYCNPKPQSNKYKLILVNNRDEFYDRPTQDAHVWDSPRVIAGKDLMKGREGGTWLCASEEGRIGCLLNIFKPKDQAISSPDIASRGFLALNFLLLNDLSSLDYLQSIKDSEIKYDKFNLVLFDINRENFEIYYYNNEDRNIVSLNPGIHGFGNCYGRRKFRKVSQGEMIFNEITKELDCKTSQDELIKALFHMMSGREQFYPDEVLSQQGVGYNETFLRGLSSLSVHIPSFNYGTRTTTVILIDDENQLHFEERTMADPSPKTLLTSESTVIGADCRCPSIFFRQFAVPSGLFNLR